MRSVRHAPFVPVVDPALVDTVSKRVVAFCEALTEDEEARVLCLDTWQGYFQGGRTVRQVFEAFESMYGRDRVQAALQTLKAQEVYAQGPPTADILPPPSEGPYPGRIRIIYDAPPREWVVVVYLEDDAIAIVKNFPSLKDAVGYLPELPGTLSAPALTNDVHMTVDADDDSARELLGFDFTRGVHVDPADFSMDEATAKHLEWLRRTWSGSELLAMTVKDLHLVAKAKGVSTAGKKSDLVAAILGIPQPELAEPWKAGDWNAVVKAGQTVGWTREWRTKKEEIVGEISYDASREKWYYRVYTLIPGTLDATNLGEGEAKDDAIAKAKAGLLVEGYIQRQPTGPPPTPPEPIPESPPSEPFGFAQAVDILFRELKYYVTRLAPEDTELLMAKAADLIDREDTQERAKVALFCQAMHEVKRRYEDRDKELNGRINKGELPYTDPTVVEANNQRDAIIVLFNRFGCRRVMRQFGEKHPAPLGRLAHVAWLDPRGNVWPMLANESHLTALDRLEGVLHIPVPHDSEDAIASGWVMLGESMKLKPAVRGRFDVLQDRRTEIVDFFLSEHVDASEQVEIDYYDQTGRRVVGQYRGPFADLFEEMPRPVIRARECIVHGDACWAKDEERVPTDEDRVLPGARPGDAVRTCGDAKKSTVFFHDLLTTGQAVNLRGDTIHLKPENTQILIGLLDRLLFVMDIAECEVPEDIYEDVWSAWNERWGDRWDSERKDYLDRLLTDGVGPGPETEKDVEEIEGFRRYVDRLRTLKWDNIPLREQRSFEEWWWNRNPMPGQGPPVQLHPRSPWEPLIRANVAIAAKNRLTEGLVRPSPPSDREKQEAQAAFRATQEQVAVLMTKEDREGLTPVEKQTLQFADAIADLGNLEGPEFMGMVTELYDRHPEAKTGGAIPKRDTLLTGWKWGDRTLMGIITLMVDKVYDEDLSIDQMVQKVVEMPTVDLGLQPRVDGRELPAILKTRVPRRPDTEELYRCEDRMTEAIKKCAEQLRIFHGLPLTEYWKSVMASELYTVLDLFGPESSESAAKALLEERGYRVEPPAEGRSAFAESDWFAFREAIRSGGDVNGPLLLLMGEECFRPVHPDLNALSKEPDGKRDAKAAAIESAWIRARFHGLNLTIADRLGIGSVMPFPRVIDAALMQDGPRYTIVVNYARDPKRVLSVAEEALLDFGFRSIQPLTETETGRFVGEYERVEGYCIPFLGKSQGTVAGMEDEELSALINRYVELRRKAYKERLDPDEISDVAQIQLYLRYNHPLLLVAIRSEVG